MPLFNTFYKEQEAIALPNKTFDLVGPFPAEQEEGSGDEEWEVIPLIDEGGQGVDPVAHISKTADDIDRCKGMRIRISKHGAQLSGSERYPHRWMRYRTQCGCRLWRAERAARIAESQICASLTSCTSRASCYMC